MKILLETKFAKDSIYPPIGWNIFELALKELYLNVTSKKSFIDILYDDLAKYFNIPNKA